MPQSVTVPIPFPTGTSPGEKPNEGAGRLVNIYSEIVEGTKQPLWRRSPGLRYFKENLLSYGKFRGALQVGFLIYAVFGNKAVIINEAGDVTPLAGSAIGAGGASSKIWIACNNRQPASDIVIVADAVAYWIDPATGSVKAYPTEYDNPAYPADPTAPATLPNAIGTPNCVCSHMSYFMFGYPDGRVRASKSNSTNIDSVDNTGTETNPDGVDAVWSYGGQLFAAGRKTIEVFGDPVNTGPGFPLTRVGYNITPGLMAPFAVSGWQPEFGRAPIYVGSDATIRQIQGYTPQLISTHDIERDLEKLVNKTELEASIYVINGHAFWQLTCGSWTQVNDTDSQQWHQRDSYLRPRSRIVLSFPAFNKWYAGDFAQLTAPILVQITAEETGETGDPLIAHIESDKVLNFPNRIRITRADFDITVGVGRILDANGNPNPIQKTDPKVEISWSDDGGTFWSTPWVRDLGEQQNLTKRITVLNTGMSGAIGRKWRLRIPNEVHLGILGGTQSAQLRVN